MSPIAIDFEASCLPRDGRSFPIEVGIADPSGESRSWLIRPHADWSGWTWTQEAELLHGISRERLEYEGESPEAVLAALCEAVNGRRVVADSDLDVYWLDMLSAAAGRPATFTIDHVADVIDELAPTRDQAAQANERVASLDERRHRAGSDARHLALWLAALGEPVQARAVSF